MDCMETSQWPIRQAIYPRTKHLTERRTYQGFQWDQSSRADKQISTLSHRQEEIRNMDRIL
jgi:hypothetical protein